MYKLEDHLMNAKDASEINGVYWCARDLSSFFVGNHHFITFVYRDKDQADRVKARNGLPYRIEENDESYAVYFSTIGLAIDDDGAIELYKNDGDDVKSIHEIAKDDNTSAFSSDFDFEGHQIPFKASNRNYQSAEELMSAICDLQYRFMANYLENKRLDYSLIDENCAAYVNTVLKELGFSEGDREDFGEFSGTDWGEEDTIPSEFFVKPMGTYVPMGSFTDSSRNIRVILSAECKDEDGDWQESFVDLTYLMNVQVENSNGNLECVRDTNRAESLSYVPAGSFKDSSRAISVKLYATCQRANGSWQESTFDLTNLKDKVAIMNKDGQLTLQ